MEQIETKTNFEQLLPRHRRAIQYDPSSILVKDIIFRNYGIDIPREVVDIQAIIEYINSATLKKLVSLPVNKPQQQTYRIVSVTYTEKEWGTCSYSRKNYYQGEVAIPISIMEDARENDDASIIRDYVENRATEYVSLDDTSDTEYDDFESSDYERVGDIDVDTDLDDLLIEYIEEREEEGEEEE